MIVTNQWRCPRAATWKDDWHLQKRCCSDQLQSINFTRFSPLQHTNQLFLKMSEENQIPSVTDEMRRVLQEVVTKNYKFPPKEETLFSISGRGHLENPTSDLLGYFLQPKGQHGFGTCFLRAFFECMNVDWEVLNLNGVDVVSQAQTKDGKWIDLLITGLDWVLVIENKMRAPLGNPLPSYVEHAGRFAANRRFFALLSPQPINAPDWESVTYRKYCDALKSTLPTEVFKAWSSKWQVFAREFIVHLENELYNPIMTMTQEQKAFVEENLLAIEDIKKLTERYTADLLSELTTRLQCEVAGNHAFHFYPSWAFLCNETTGRLRFQFTFQTPAHEDGNRERSFTVGVFVYELSDPDRSRAQSVIEMKHSLEGSADCWDGTYKSRNEAVNALCRLAKQLFDLQQNELPASTLIERLI